MKKISVPMVVFCLSALLVTSVGMAADETFQDSFPLLINDADPAGTNLRQTPGGEVIAVIPSAPDGKIRQVRAVESRNGWFHVLAQEQAPVEGWMHSSVLAVCAYPTEDGNAALYAEAGGSGVPLCRVPSTTPMRPLERKGDWLKVRYTADSGKTTDAWMLVYVANGSPSELEECARALVRADR